MKNPHWIREELILALELYFRLEYGEMDGHHPFVIATSKLLTVMNEKKGFSRNVNAVSLKLANFKRFDPNCKGKGMKGGGKLEEDIWNEFAKNKSKLKKVAAGIIKEIVDSQVVVPVMVSGEIRKRKADPPAGPMMDSMRDLGYSTETAVADIIDNSIFARASIVRIDFLWDGDKSRIIFTDDGIGMSDDELAEAMRLGSRSPGAVRDRNDLGRFGLGLKTASLSQCRVFTVLSRKKPEALTYWRWDLDYVITEGQWDILGIAEESDLRVAGTMKNGTMVVWDKLDRIVEAGSKGDSEDNFYQVAGKVKRHIEMVFHRYLESGKLKIVFNGLAVKAWDPFLRGETATQPLPEEALENGAITVRPYILPHRNKLDKAIWQDNEDRGGGWDSMQGFYIYRNQRLLLAADWLGFRKKKSHYKLARIMIDLPNHLDHEWQIDIKKSKARPPLKLRARLKSVMMNTVSQAEEVFRHRGKQIQRSMKEEFSFVWNETELDGRYFFRINRNHPAVAALIGKLPEGGKDIERLLRLIEETVPGPSIIAKENELPDQMVKPFEKVADAELVSLMNLLAAGWKKQGMNGEDIRNRLRMTEPFGDFAELIEKIKI